MRSMMFVFLAVLAVNAQSIPAKPKAKTKTAQKVAPVPAQMSHDFRTAGRLAVTSIANLGKLCDGSLQIDGRVVCSLDTDTEFRLEGKAQRAVDEAEAQHVNAVDKSALELLKQYNRVAFDVVLDRQALAAEAFTGRTNLHHDWCSAKACETMFATCKKEAEQAFESGTMPVKWECRSLSPDANTETETSSERR